jgi:hypothetical protein
MTERLARVSDVKAWLGILPTSSSETMDTMLSRLILAASQFVLNYIDRPQFAQALYTQNFRGNGKTSMVLKYWPVVEISSLGVSNVEIPAAALNANGYPSSSGYAVSDFRDAPMSIELFGYDFCYRQPCRVVYTAGYQGSETAVIPTTPFQLSTSTLGSWVSNVSVTKNGNPLILVTTSPAAGQYMVDEEGVYTFSAADAGSTVVITFGYCPYDLAQAVIELVGEFMKRKDRIGIAAKDLGGRTITEGVKFNRSDMNETVRSILNPYQNVVPL